MCMNGVITVHMRLKKMYKKKKKKKKKKNVKLKTLMRNKPNPNGH